MNKRIQRKKEKQIFNAFVSEFKIGTYYYDCGYDIKKVYCADIKDDTLSGTSIYHGHPGNCSFRHCGPEIITDINEVEFAKFFYDETGFYFRKFYPYSPGLFTCSFKDEEIGWDRSQSKIWLHYFDLLISIIEKYNRVNSFILELKEQINKYRKALVITENSLTWNEIISERDRY